MALPLRHLGQVVLLSYCGLSAPFIVGLEFLGGILIMLGLGSRLIALLLTCDMLVAFIAADREALFSIFSDPDNFCAATPYTFLIAFLIVLIFGPGRLSLDALPTKHWGAGLSPRGA